MFPLNAVLFPGVSVPLTVFEDRYRALVHHLLRVEDPAERVFGSVGIREGYEVGDHGAQSLYRVGCRVQLTEVEAHPDGTFDDRRGRAGPDRARAPRHHRHLPGRPRRRPARDPRRRCPTRSLERARATFTAYRDGARRDPQRPLHRHAAPATRRTSPGRWPRSRRCPCTSGRRCSRPRTPSDRLIMVTDLLRAELRAMNVIPSLPATEVARTRWSPN